MPKNATTLVFLGLMVLMLVWMGYSGRRARAKMAARYRNGVNHLVAKLGRKPRQLIFRQLTQFVRRRNFIE